MAEKFYSSRLLNYVERVDVGGFAKTAFYTEVNTNLKPGDRIFIQNGNYDSDEFIDQDRYAKYVDGYRILSIDRCRIVLDIDYIGLKPYEEDQIDNFIKIWNVKELRDLVYYDSIIVDAYNNRRVSKFEWKLSNNLIFSAATYSVTRPDSTSYTIGQPNSIWAKKSNGTWEIINNDFNNNTFVATGATAYFGGGYTIGNNGRVFIYGEDFVYNGKVFKQRNVYKYQDGEWIIDTKFKPAILSKLNFRDGQFKGTHYDGVWGTYQKSLKWYGTFSNWQSGVLVNSDWYSGNLNSKSTIASQSFYATITNVGLPVQTSDFSNNRQQGYNYVLDSNVLTGNIADGNFINCNIGSTISSTVSVVDDYYNQVESFKLIAKGGAYTFCDVWDSKITDASIFDSRVYNSDLNQTRLLNSQFFDVVADGEFNAENGITVLSADIYSYIPNLAPGIPQSDSSKIRGVLKLFISEKDLMRLDSFDNFYITKINKNFVVNSLTSDQRVILPYETKYILDRFYNADFSQQEFTATIKNPSDNKYKPYVTATGSNFYNTFQLSGVTYSSIDLDLGQILAHYYQGGSNGNLVVSNPTYSVVETTRVINHLNVSTLFSNTVLKNGDFVSGILEGSTWTSGALINRQSNIIESLSNNRPSITINGDNLSIQIGITQSFFDGTLKVGKNIWLDSIYNNPGRKASIELYFNNWSASGTSAEDQGATFSTYLGTFSFMIPLGSSYGSTTDSYIQNVVIPNLASTSMSTYYNFYSNSTAGIPILKIQSKETGISYSITSTQISLGSNITTVNNTSGVNYVGTNVSGRYKVVNIQPTNGTIILQSQQGLSASTLTANEFFFDSEVNPNFLSINQVLVRNSTIISGLFKRSLISNSIFYNESFDNTDKSISPNNIDKLRITKTVFKNNKNDVKSGLFYRDHFFGGTFSGGIAYETIWKDAIFKSGIFKSGYWKNGTFAGGKFIESPGTTASTLAFSSPSEFQSWVDGNFTGGEFDSSVWRNGTFSNGKFFNSDWYAGVWQNGILGDINIPYSKTTMASKTINYLINGATSSVWLDGVVENAQIGGDGAVYWFGGKFNNGLFTSNGTGQINGSNFRRESIWYGGEFNGGEFDKLSKWKNGDFNGGWFNSHYGWTFSNLTASEYYSWENGNFNGGKFGNAGYGTNSTWHDGIFNDGIFQGRLWNYGIFNKGTFNGGATWSPRVYETNFVNSFTNSYYGIWRDGIVIDVKTNIPSDSKFFTTRKRVNETKKTNVDVTLKNMLWLNGTFSSNSATFDTSAWLGGRFVSGKFVNSIFNPYVDRRPFDSTATQVLSFNKDSKTVWVNGDFESGSFYFSEWQNGTFKNGTMSGAIWRNGTWLYGDANNIYWEDGRWRNGNWDGSPFTPETFGVTGSFNPYQLGPGVNQFWFYSSVSFAVSQQIKIYQGTNQVLGTVNSSSPFFSIFSVIIDVTSGTPTLSSISKIEKIESITDYQKELMVRVSQVGGISNSASASIHLINAFTPPQVSPEILAVEPDLFGNNIPEDFWSTFTFSNNSYLGGLNNTNTYIAFRDDVKVATTTNISLSGTQSIDGVLVAVGDRVLVKNQIATQSNGVYVVSASGWVRASDADTASKLTTYKSGAITFNPGYTINEGNVNKGYVFTQNIDLFPVINASTYSISSDSITIATNPNLSNGVPIQFINIGGITNVNTSITYYVKNLSGATFNITIDSDPLSPILNLLGVVSSQVKIKILKDTLGTQNIRFITDGAAIWNYVELCTAGEPTYCYPASTVIGPYDITNKLTPNWRNTSKPLFVLAKGATAAVFSEPVGLGGYYYVEVKYAISNLGVSTQNGTLSIRYGATYSPNDFPPQWAQNQRNISFSLSASSATYGVATFSYAPDSNTANNAFLITNDQTYVDTGLGKMIGKVLAIHPGISGGSTNQVKFDIYSVSVVKYASKYDNTYNNKIYNPFSVINPTYSSDALLPNSVVKLSVSDSGGLISLKYGNGSFRSGIWENGVWNNGWRNDDTTMRCLLNSNLFNLTESITSASTIGSKNVSLSNSVVGIDYIKNSTYTYTIALKSIDPIKSIYKVGDKISISNIVAIDQNESRSLIKGYSTITSINQTTREIIVSCNVPLNTIRIETDSQEHIILVTKNIWQSGAFLNGYFRGVWNYGLFQGYPYITLMEDSHWIDGVFDGGTLRGGKSSFTYSATSGVQSKTYSVPLVQNFEYFTDNNISSPSEYLSSDGYKYYTNVANYLSWIDVNYFTSSKTNIGQENTLYDINLESDTYQINLNGYPTNDILSSKSNFRDLTSKNSKDYSLGVKYKVYNNFIPNSNLINQFFEPVSNSTLNLPLSGSTLASKLLKNFTKYGWTYSTSSGSLRANISSNIFSSSSLTLNINLAGTTSFILLDNSEIDIESNRYSVLEFTLSKFSGSSTYSKTEFNGRSVEYPSIYLRNDPRSDSPGTPYHQAINRDIVNHVLTPDPIKREFFYNRNTLSMYIYGRVQTSFTNISFKEIDMIPFFQYATQSLIDDDIKSPYRATAPFIDYTNSNFNFISNISINIDTVGNYSIPYTGGIADVNFNSFAGGSNVVVSDYRVKTNISRMGKSDSGINVYTFEYFDRPGIIYKGVMAQELIGTQYENALVIKDNLYHVNYSLIDVKFEMV